MRRTTSLASEVVGGADGVTQDVMQGSVESAKICQLVSQDRIHERSVEQSVGISERVDEQVVDVPMPQVLDESSKPQML